MRRLRTHFAWERCAEKMNLSVALVASIHASFMCLICLNFGRRKTFSFGSGLFFVCFSSPEKQNDVFLFP